MSSKRHPTTEWMHPDKVSVEEFISTIKGDADSFAANMNHLKNIPEEMYPEGWIELYAKWLDMRRYEGVRDEL